MLIRLAVLVIALVLPGAGLAGNAIDRATEMNRAIHSGAASELRDALPPLTEIEFAELARLAGCEPRQISLVRSDEADAATVTAFEWSCGSGTSAEGLRRTTTIVLDEDNEVAAFAINGAARAETDRAIGVQPVADLDERAIMVEFGRAVIAGGDAMRDALVPLDVFDRARLEPYVGGSFRLSSWFDGESFRISFIEGSGRSAPARIAHVAFDDGRPVGFVFAPTRIPREVRRRKPIREYTTDLRLTVPRNTDAYNPCANC